MQTLKFKLISNKETLINESTSYYIKDNIINFKINDELYSYNLENNILIKTNKEYKITNDFENYNIIIEIPESNSMFNMEILDYTIHIDNNKILIKYKYLGDEEIENSIFIEY